eukprot:1596790-Prymnesium_polylepis.1
MVHANGYGFGWTGVSRSPNRSTSTSSVGAVLDMGLIIETGAVLPAPFPSRPLRPASRTSCLKFTFCRRR